MTRNLLDERTLFASWRSEEQGRRALLQSDQLLRSKVSDVRKLPNSTGELSEEHARLLKLVDAQPALETALPSTEERDAAILEYRSGLPADMMIVQPTAFGEHEEIFGEAPTKNAETIQSFFSTNVPREQTWALRHRILAQNGGSATLASHYWRYRIWVPNFDTSKYTTRALKVVPHAFVRGAVTLFAAGPQEPESWALHRYYTGTWHYRYDQGYKPTWSKWRPSFSRFNQEQAAGVVLSSYSDDRTYDRTISETPLWWRTFVDTYPGVSVETPAKLLPPGIGQNPNPVNLYAYVRPLDVVDFYVRPHTFVDTNASVSIANLDLTIDVPFVAVRFDVPDNW